MLKGIHQYSFHALLKGGMQWPSLISALGTDEIEYNHHTFSRAHVFEKHERKLDFLRTTTPYTAVHRDPTKIISSHHCNRAGESTNPLQEYIGRSGIWQYRSHVKRHEQLGQ